MVRWVRRAMANCDFPLIADPNVTARLIVVSMETVARTVIALSHLGAMARSVVPTSRAMTLTNPIANAAPRVENEKPRDPKDN